MYSIAQAISYDTLERETVGNLYNAHFLIETNAEEPQEIKRIATEILNQFTSDGKKLNQVYFWRDDSSFVKWKYRRGQFRTDNFDYSKEKLKIALDKWDRDYRLKICDNLLAIYSGTHYGIDLFPYRDSDYKKYGGTKKRPEVPFVLLVLDPPSIQSSEADDEKSGGSIAQIVLIALIMAGVLIYTVLTAKKRK